jgi:beta-lactam-binding protein with PASTA domain
MSQPNEHQPGFVRAATWWDRQPRWKWLVLAVALWIVIGLSLKLASGGTDLRGAPNVQGLTLDVAEQQLKNHGFGADVHDNALFGVIVASHFTVCDEHSPIGHLVVVDVSKQC